MENQVEPNPTPDAGGASTLDPLDRIERMLAAEDGPGNQQSQSQDGDPAATTVETDDDANGNSQPQITTTDLAKFLGVDETMLDLDEDGGVKFKTKIDGQEGTAKLADFFKTYQIQGHAENRVKEVQKQEEALRAKAQEAETQFAQRLQYAEGLANLAAQQLLAEFQSIDWKALEQQDAGTAALYRQKFQEKQAQLRGVFHNIQQEKQQGAEKGEARERERLSVLIPEWKDAAVASRERQEILSWLPTAGFQPEDLDMNKASTIALLRRTMLADRVQKAKPEVENRVRTAPKLVKPGQAQVNNDATKAQGLKLAVKKSGGKSDAVEAYLIGTGRV